MTLVVSVLRYVEKNGLWVRKTGLKALVCASVTAYHITETAEATWCLTVRIWATCKQRLLHSVFHLNPFQHLHHHAIDIPPRCVTEDLQDEERHPHEALVDGDVAAQCEDSQLGDNPLQPRKLSPATAAPMYDFSHLREAAVGCLFDGFLLRGLCCREGFKDLFEGHGPFGVQRFSFHVVFGLVNHGEEADEVAVFELGAVRGGVDISKPGFESLDGAGICSVDGKSRELSVEEVLHCYTAFVRSSSCDHDGAEVIFFAS